ncbi:flagellar protein FlgN [Halomonas sp. YLGW01]|uniref:flagella synthesis protein FlgN n=1 Tax=Halomonas sp. YLGW01 TaxID=2773308 RepID=UPI00177DDE91|nr:flagellar protein FlgN [Halomonas sp. YLGW01]
MSLGDHLSQQHRRLEALETLLEQERQTLCQGRVDGERLSHLATDKQALLAQIERFETQRSQAQQRLGYEPGLTGAARAAEDAGCLPIWQTLLDTAQRTARLNRLNGDMIRQRLEQNQRMLNALREAAGNSLYGPNGQTRPRQSQLSSRA